MPKVLVVDQNDAGFSDMVLSGVLKEKIEERLKQREQIIILQNRRGHSTFLRCGTCGWIDRCTRCSITLTFHRKDHRLKCHYCDFSKRPADVCPSCGSATFQYRGIGTQKVEETLVSLFPDVRLFRMDSDTMRRKGEHGRIVIGFEKGEADVLLGTQMVAKGHDFPQVTLVGVVSADTGLHFPDFRSGERAFQLLVQAAGRAGRRDKQGEVVIQTRSPDHPVLRFSVDQDYDGFYKYESAQRKDLDYPPWGRLILVRFQGIREKAVEEAAEDFARFIPSLPACQVLGPIPSPISRIKGMHRFQMILRTSKDLDPSGRILRDKVQKAHSLWTSKTRHRDVRMAVDVDPIDLM
jgi:primosomal protein N' (replication factor Y)